MPGERVEARYGVGVKDNSRSALSKMRQNLGLTKTAFAGLAIAAAGSAAGLAKFLTSAIRTGDEFAKMAAKANVTGGEMQRLAYHARLSGSSQEVVAKSLVKVQSAMYDAEKGTKTYTDAFKDLGVNFQNADGTLRGVHEVFLELADAISQSDNKAAALGASVKILGRGGADLGRFFAAGSASIRKSGDELERFGGLMSDDLLKATEDMTDAWERFKTSMTGIRNQLIEPLLPLLIAASEAAAKLFASFTGAGASSEAEKTAQWLDNSRTSMREIADDAHRWLEAERELARLRADGVRAEGGPRPVDYEARAAAGARTGIHGEGRRPETEAQVMLRHYRDHMTAQVQLYETLGMERERAIMLIREMIAAEGGYMAQAQELTERVGTLTNTRREATEVIEEEKKAHEELQKVVGDYGPPVPPGWLKKLQRVKDITEGLQTPLEIYKQDMAELHELYTDGLLPLEAYIAAQEQLRDAMTHTSEDLKDLETDGVTTYERMRDAAGDAAYSMEQALFGAIEGQRRGLEAFKDWAIEVFDEIARAAFRIMIIEPLANLIAGGMPGGGGTGRQSGGGPRGRASGGPVAPNQVYMVGERGPEYFKPNTAGEIVPAGAGAPINLKWTIYAMDSRDVGRALGEHKATITSFIQEAWNARGLRGPNG